MHRHPPNIAVDEFREQLTHLRDADYTVLDMATFRRHLDEGTAFPERSVLITIDDPYQSIHEHGWPVLREFGFPFTLFVWTECLEGEYGAMMGWDEVEEMAAAGVTIGNHSHSHPRLATPAPDESDDAFRARVDEELAVSQRLLRAHGIDTDLYAYPYGEYNAVVVDAVADAGFTIAFTQVRGPLDHRTDPLRLPREALVGAEQTLADFREKLSYVPLHLADAVPRWGLLDENPPPVIELMLADPDRFEGGVNVFVSEWGRVDATYDASTGRVRFVPEKPLTRTTNRVLVSSRDRATGRFGLPAYLIAVR